MDPLESLDLDKLQALITILKDAEVPYFRLGDLEVGFGGVEKEPPVSGFVPRSEQAVVKAAEAEVAGETKFSGYQKAFGGAVPRFKKG